MRATRSDLRCALAFVVSASNWCLRRCSGTQGTCSSGNFRGGGGAGGLGPALGALSQHICNWKQLLAGARVRQISDCSDVVLAHVQSFMSVKTRASST